MGVTIDGHPYVEAHRPGASPLQIIVCANCEQIRTILFLDEDRWFCTTCRNEGNTRPTQVAIKNPARK